MSHHRHYLRPEQRVSIGTVQATLTAMKGFTQWLAANEKLPNNLLASVRKPNPESDRRRERRILLPEEWQMLHGSTVRAPTAYGMTSNERVLLYELAIQTVLRSNELRSLTRGQLFLDGEHPKVIQTVMCHSMITLTMDTYGHLFPGQASGAVQKLASLTNPLSADRATGTAQVTSGGSAARVSADGKSVSQMCRALQLAQQSGRETAPTSAKRCDDPQEESPEDDSHNPLRIAKIGGKLLGSVRVCSASAPLAQLAEQLTLNQ